MEPEEQATMSDPVTEIKESDDKAKRKRQRERRRGLYEKICKQIEFYFSDANIMKDRMMKSLLQESEYIEVSKFLTFNKLKSLTGESKYLVKSILRSKKLELSEDQQYVRRKIPFDEKAVKDDETVEACTIYVENIPKHCDHDWLDKVFHVFGPVAYISLPKFRHNKVPKGFAFIEFENKDSARRCLEAYGHESEVDNANIDPASLMSIKTYDRDEEDSETPQSHRPLKRKLEKTECDSETAAKVPKVQEEGSSEVEKVPCDDAKVSSKKSRKRHKKKKMEQEQMESDFIQLQVLPKKTWRQLRNRYLNLQRHNMGKLKKAVRAKKLKTDHYKNFYYQNGVKNHRNSDCKVLKIELDPSDVCYEDFHEHVLSDLGKQTGCTEIEKEGNTFFKFVDYKPNNPVAYVRVNGDDIFSSCLEKLAEVARNEYKSAEFLTDKEATEYRKNVLEHLRENEHKKRLNENHRKPSVRGKDKILLAASKINNHVRFD